MKIYIYNLEVYDSLISKLSLCVLLQYDQATSWSSVKNQMDLRKTHSKKMTKEASTHGAITLPKHELYMNTRERELK